MFCPNCGKQLKENAKFCPVCGVKINSKEIPNRSFKAGAGVGLATWTGFIVLFYFSMFVILLTCTPADAKGFRIACIICFVPVLLLCVLLIIKNTDYIIVEGNQFYAKRFLKKYTFSCGELERICYYSHTNPNGGRRCGVALSLQDNKVLHAEYGYKTVFKADSRYKNFRRFAGYLSELHDAGVIGEEVISPEEKEKLLLLARGKRFL